jgi:hypothetical protein
MCRSSAKTASSAVAATAQTSPTRNVPGQTADKLVLAS